MDLMDKIEPLKDSMYILRADNLSASEVNNFKKTWGAMITQAEEPKTLLVMHSRYDFMPIRGQAFDFTAALWLLKLGYKVKRSGWLGYIYIHDGNIYHNSSYTLTHEDLLGTDWELVKE
jgi:hypothetical protein